jgi:hypothetical protein
MNFKNYFEKPSFVIHGKVNLRLFKNGSYKLPYKYRKGMYHLFLKLNLK